MTLFSCTLLSTICFKVFICDLLVLWWFCFSVFPMYFHFIAVGIQTLCTLTLLSKLVRNTFWSLSSTIKVLYIVQNLEITDGWNIFLFSFILKKKIDLLGWGCSSVVELLSSICKAWRSRSIITINRSHFYIIPVPFKFHQRKYSLHQGS